MVAVAALGALRALRRRKASLTRSSSQSFMMGAQFGELSLGIPLAVRLWQLGASFDTEA